MKLKMVALFVLGAGACKHMASSTTKTNLLVPSFEKATQYLFTPSLERSGYLEIRSCDVGSDVQVDNSQLQAAASSGANQATAIQTLIDWCNPRPKYFRYFHKEAALRIFERQLLEGDLSALGEGPLKQQLQKYRTVTPEKASEAAVAYGDLLAAIRIRQELVDRLQEEANKLPESAEKKEKLAEVAAAKTALLQSQNNIPQLSSAQSPYETALSIRNQVQTTMTSVFEIGAPKIVVPNLGQGARLDHLLLLTLAEGQFKTEEVRIGGNGYVLPLASLYNGDVIFAKSTRAGLSLDHRDLSVTNIYTQKTQLLSASADPQHKMWRSALLGYDLSTVAVQRSDFHTQDTQYVLFGKIDDMCVTRRLQTDGNALRTSEQSVSAETVCHDREALGHQLSFDGRYYQTGRKSIDSSGQSRINLNNKPMVIAVGDNGSQPVALLPNKEIFSPTLVLHNGVQHVFGCALINGKITSREVVLGIRNAAGTFDIQSFGMTDGFTPQHCSIGAVPGGVIVWGKDQQAAQPGLYRKDFLRERSIQRLAGSELIGHPDNGPFLSLPDGRVLITTDAKAGNKVFAVSGETILEKNP